MQLIVVRPHKTQFLLSIPLKFRNLQIKTFKHIQFYFLSSIPVPD